MVNAGQCLLTNINNFSCLLFVVTIKIKHKMKKKVITNERLWEKRSIFV
jgi:hypothetical protein